MNLIEIETKMAKNGIIQIPRDELEVTGLKEGDDVCLLYVVHSDGNRGKILFLPCKNRFQPQQPPL